MMQLVYPEPIKLEDHYDVEKDMEVQSDGTLKYREENDDKAPSRDFLSTRAKNGDIVITLVGPSGTGKTTNAKRIAKDKNQTPPVVVRDIDEALLEEMKDAEVYDENNIKSNVNFIGNSITQLLAESNISAENKLKLTKFLYEGGGEGAENAEFIWAAIFASDLDKNDKQNLVKAIKASLKDKHRLEGQTIAFKYDKRARKHYDDGVPFLINQVFNDARKDGETNYLLSPPGCVIARKKKLIREIREKSLVVAILANPKQKEVAIKEMKGKPITLLDNSREKTFEYREGLYLPAAHVVMPSDVLSEIDNMKAFVDACIEYGDL